MEFQHNETMNETCLFWGQRKSNRTASLDISPKNVTKKAILIVVKCKTHTAPTHHPASIPSQNPQTIFSLPRAKPTTYSLSLTTRLIAAPPHLHPAHSSPLSSSLSLPVPTKCKYVPPQRPHVRRMASLFLSGEEVVR